MPAFAWHRRSSEISNLESHSLPILPSSPTKRVSLHHGHTGVCITAQRRKRVDSTNGGNGLMLGETDFLAPAISPYPLISFVGNQALSAKPATFKCGRRSAKKFHMRKSIDG